MTTTRPLTAPERTLLDGAMIRTLDMVPYYAAALLRLTPIAVDGIGTFAVDAHWRLYIDPATLTEWGPEASAAVLAHEVNHVLRDHGPRAHALAVTDHTVWNIAGDAAINADLLAVGIPLPGNPVTPEAIDLPNNWTEEDYYAALMDRAGAPESDQSSTEDEGSDGGTGCGSGSGDIAAEWELPASDPNAPALDPMSQSAIRQQVAHDVTTAATKNPGTVPAGMTRWAEHTLAPPTVNWKRHLRATIRAAAAWARGDHDYTYSRPARRPIPGIITPATHSPQPTVAVVIDTSGSMSRVALDAALAEVNGILRALRATITVVNVDATADVQRNVRDTNQITLTGGGGTDMRVGITEALRAKPAPNIIIVLTDGYTPWPDQPLRQPLIVGIIGAAPLPDAFAPPAWARTVTIPTD